ncbi:PIN domain-containing protein [Halorutilales archaeon Cl-col2-1]
MKILDTSFLIDYFNGSPDTKRFYEDNGGDSQHWIIPAPAYAEILVGEGNYPDGDLEAAEEYLSWGEIYSTDAETAIIAGEIADEIGSEGPFLGGIDGLIAAVGRDLDAPVVSRDTDLTHPETKKVIEIEEYS